jgi:predicted enzyme related to lactoylglutathione lyase
MPQPYPNGELVVVIDCSDLDRSAGFWAAVLGYTPVPASTGSASTGSASTGSASTGSTGTGPYRGLTPESGAGIDLLLQRVPDVKGQKNRLHLDLRTPDLDAEVRRVLGLGATLLTREPVAEDGWLWHILADPDGNEFCVLQPPAD